MALDSLDFDQTVVPVERTHHGMEQGYIFSPETDGFVDAVGKAVASDGLTASKALELYRARVAHGLIS